MCGHSTNKCTLVKALVQKDKLKKQKANKERKYTKHEVDILLEKKMKKALWKRKKQHAEKWHSFENINVSDSDEESSKVSSSEEVEVWKIGSDKNPILYNKLSSTKLKKPSKTFFNLDDCIHANYNYESLHSCNVSQPNKKFNKKDWNSIFSRKENLFPITFGELTPTKIKHLHKNIKKWVLHQMM